MVRAISLDRERTIQKSKSFHLKRMLDNFGRHVQSHLNQDNDDTDQADDRTCSRKFPGELSIENQDIGWVFYQSMDGDDGGSSRSQLPSEVELIKERFVKLLGEDMSGGEQGVSSAWALLNVITNLAASMFGEQSKLEPMQPERKARWRKEIKWPLFHHIGLRVS